MYDREKEKLLNEASLQPSEHATTDAPPPVPTSLRSETGLRSERKASASGVAAKDMAVRKDSIDELILDLNRLYGEQR